MADRNLELALRMRADLQQARRQLDQVERDLSGIAQEGDRAGRDTSRGLERIGTAARTLTGVLAGLTVGGTILTAIARRSAQAASELTGMARISNTTVEQFQRLAYAAGEYNVEQGKVADILKDLHDRIGDFLQTGAGEFVDFFENIAPQVGLTADELARMSGPEALQAVYNALDAAGLSTSELTFYLEALANDATALVPLLRNNGEELSRLADEADRTNTVLSRLEVQRLRDLRSEFRQLEQQLSTETSRAVSQFDELMTSSLERIGWAVENTARGFNSFMDSFREAENKRSIEGINAELEALFDNRDRLAQRIDMFGEDSEQARQAQAAMQELREEYGRLIDRKKELLAPENEVDQSTFTPPPQLTPLGRYSDTSGADDAAREYESALQALQQLDQGLREQIATFGEGDAAAMEYRLTVGDLADDVARLGAEGEALAASIVQQAREVERLTEAEERQAEAQRERQQAQQQAEENLQRILDQADPARALERQLELIEQLKQQFPEYAEALEQAAGQVKARIDEINQGFLSARQINAQFSYGAANAFDSFASDLADGKDAIDSLGDAFAQFAADFLRQIAQMIIQQAIFNALQNMGGGGVGGAIAGFLGGGGGGGGGLYANVAAYHTGGIAGQGGSPRRVPADVFAFAPRYHSGGMAGLAPNEVPTILQRGEEVLTEDDPRHRNNQGGQGAGERGTTIVNTFDAGEMVSAGLSTPAGERVIMNFISRNRQKVNSTLGRS